MEGAEDDEFHHFSHQHPLEHTIMPSGGNITCYGCSLEIVPGKEYYNCKTCSFALHRVCSNMPGKTQHPAHPNHYLALLVSPSSAKSNLKCKACAYYISGFYYYCADCSIHYHSLCLNLPFSVTVTSHLHPLKIEFSPPYEFCCDLCDKPSYKGWSYRCRFCEFDSHISCAISNQSSQAQPLLADALRKQITYSSASIRETNREIGHDSESNELMQLIIQGAARSSEERNNKEVIYTTTLAGWDERLNSPVQRNGRIGQLGLYQTKPFTPRVDASPREQLRSRDQSTQVSEDLTIQSYQLSELCFSIDLLKSPSSYQKRDVPEVEEMTNHNIVVIANRTSSDLQPVKPVLNPLYRGPENRLKEAFLTRGFTNYGGKLGENQVKMRNKFGGKSDYKDQSVESDTGCCCWKFMCCSSPPRYEKCSNKSFKRGGL